MPEHRRQFGPQFKDFSPGSDAAASLCAPVIIVAGS